VGRGGDVAADAAGVSPAPLAQQIVAAPVVRERVPRVDAWLAEIAASPAGRAVAELVRGNAALRGLFDLLSDSSPHLWDLASSEPARLLTVLNCDPQLRFTAILAEAVAAIAATADEAETMRLLRRMKAEAALLIGLADIGGVWPVMRVTRALTELADAALGAAVRFLITSLVTDGKLIPPDPAHPELGSGYVVLAMGKMGAFELNYSSDIDLIVFFDQAVPRLAPGIEAAPLFIRLTRGLVKLMQERTVDGYVFRVDLRLRPDPSSTQVAISTAAALDYYESIGQNWERAALIKARPCAGDIAAGEALLKELAPFIWRKYLDYAAIADVHAMKRQIHAFKGHAAISVEGHNVKLGRGGIREIEFFVQTQQLIAGGRHPQLRGRETLAMLTVLSDGGWIRPEAADELAAAYRFLRTVEHRLQMVADEQTHVLPSDPAALGRFAGFLGFAGRDAFADVLLAYLGAVQQQYARLFEEAPASTAKRLGLNFPADHDDSATLDRLGALGFRQPLAASGLVRCWLGGGYPALRSEIARRHLAELAPVLLDHLSRAEDPDRTLVSFDRFIAGLRGGLRLFSLLRQNPDVVALLAIILGTAPRLADIVARHPQVMDALIDPAFFGVLADEARLMVGFDSSLGQARSYEDFLDRTRLLGHEHMFLIGARILSGTVSAEQAGEAFARLADVLIRAVEREVERSFCATHGRVRGQETAVLALGKLGGREMTAGSDLDLIVIYDLDPEQPASDGARVLHGSQYFARLTQRLVSALATPTNYGSLYHVDMRLRPSGRSGPVATQVESFRSYQEQEAWTWEHMALTRARVVSASSPAFAARIEAIIRATLSRERNVALIADDVVEMRRALAQEKGENDRWNLKYAAGGLIDLEFLAQYLQLVHAAKHPEILDTSTARALDKAWQLGLIEAREAEILRPAARLYHNLTQILRLCLSAPFDPRTAGGQLLRLLARAADVPDFPALEGHLADTQARVRKSFIRVLGRTP
jgi:[glutamine synthetase] adenylyltransferase / [glutamine synthetase]-adenylyl-L-tyrosine phosphorylase